MKKIIFTILLMCFCLIRINALEVNISKSNNNSLTLNWNDDNSEIYKIYRSDKKNGKYKLIKEININSFTNYGLKYGKTYYYKIVGKTTSKTVYKKVIPNTVNNFHISSVSSSNIKVSWDKEDVTGYEIYRSTNNKNWSKVKTITSKNTNSYNNTKLKLNKTYFYKIRSYIKVNGKKVYSSFSNVISFKTLSKDEINAVNKINSYKIKYSKNELFNKLKCNNNVKENAIKYLKIDFSKNALENMNIYMNLFSFSKEEIIKQLNEYDKFNINEIEYAINNYNGEFGNELSSSEKKYNKDFYVLGYSNNEINEILNNFSLDEIKKYLSEIKFNNLLGFKQSPYFNIININRYQNYYDKNKYSEIDTVMYVEIGLDYDFYTNMKPSNVNDGKLILVNKYNYINKNYNANVEKLGSGYGNGSLNKEAAKYFREMVNDAKKDGIKLWSVSAYRSYSTQNSLYNRYVSNDGKQKADTYSARPGHSEHNLGLAVDINCASSSRHFEKTKEYKWLKDNSYKYGFIERYPLGKEFITGYKYEPWHFRYLGSEVATEVYELNVTYEEYLVIKGK